MTDEQLIEQLAEIRAAQMANVFTGIAILERIGVKADDQMPAIDVMLTKFAEYFENSMRKAAGLDPRSESRPLVLKTINEEAFDSIDWDKLMEF